MSNRESKLADHVAETMVQTAKDYLNEGDGCLAILCDVCDIPFFQKQLFVEGRLLHRHHTFLFGNMEVPEDSRFKTLFEVWLVLYRLFQGY